MNPLEKRIDDLEKEVANLKGGTSPEFIEALRRFLELPTVFVTKLDDLIDVTTTGVSDDEVLKYNESSGLFEPAADDT